MKKAYKSLKAPQPDNLRKLIFIAQSGLEVNAYDNDWMVLPNKGKGNTLKVGWVHYGVMCETDRSLLLDAFIYYAKSKAASTASGVITNVKPFLMKGFMSLAQIETLWSGLKTNNKKGLNQLFGTLAKQGHIRFQPYHAFTSTHLDKINRRSLDPEKGALTDIEFDSFAKTINNKLSNFNWLETRVMSFYQSGNCFGELRNQITSKLLLSIVRRPIQLSMMKWADVIPVGGSFNSDFIRCEDEIGTVGSEMLQVRVFVAKVKGSLGPRSFPERYPLHLTEEFSSVIIQYKKLYLKGIKLLVESSGMKVKDSDLIRIMDDMPVFPSIELFNGNFGSITEFKRMFTKVSTAYHVAESSITGTIAFISLVSERVANPIVTSNRIRHTVLTRAAQGGLSAAQLAKITGVTEPAARHYIDLDYKARRLIDSNYIGNTFLDDIFKGEITAVELGGDDIVDEQFNPVGGSLNKQTCLTCSTVMGRPLGCYGCPNFRPILEADHRVVLSTAENKRLINQNALISPLKSRSIEKLDRQIEWLKLTIDFCDRTLLERSAIDAK